MIPICKAKRIDNGEWVEGYVVNTPMNNCVIILEETVLFEDYEHPCLRINNGDWFQVHPSTVCLWTGKTDKNGVKIWDGDRVKSRHNGHIQVVQWQEDIASFMLVEPDDLKEKAEPRDSLIATERRYEVIGSIHDKEGER